jgi:CRISPR system Cascade subunit CasD
MERYLVLRLEAPLVAFGGEAIDNYGVIRPFPAKSMMTGMLANALGLERQEGKVLQALQDKLIMGSRIESQERLLRDFQTVELSKSDQGWTTRERVEGRAGGAGSYAAPHLRYRDYWTDANTTVVLRTHSAAPFTLDQVESALREPARPLFIGRKSCIPSAFILNGDVSAKSVFHALMALWDNRIREPARLQWPASEGPLEDDVLLRELGHFRVEPICDERNWITGVHAGERMVHVLDVDPGDWGNA